MVKAVIFDVDGTLVDSVDLHARAWQDAFAEFGHPVGFDAIRGQIGKGGDQLLPVFLSRTQIDDFGAALEARRGDILHERYLHRITAFTGVRALFQRLIGDGKQVALASSAKGPELDHYKRLAEITDLVAVQTSSDDAERSKPHPDIFQAAMRRLPDMAPDEMLVVGDTPYDAQAASKAGLRTVGMLCGGFPEADLRAAGCIAIYADPADLLARYADWAFWGRVYSGGS
jgi:HAD superfamily hydrolase (TIGR01509 family)